MNWAAVELLIFTSVLIKDRVQNDSNYKWILSTYFHTYANIYCFICRSKITIIISKYRCIYVYLICFKISKLFF